MVQDVHCCRLCKAVICLRRCSADGKSQYIGKPEPGNQLLLQLYAAAAVLPDAELYHAALPRLFQKVHDFSTADAEQVGNGLLGIIFHIIIPSCLDRQHFFIILFRAAGIQWNHPLQQMSSIISNVLNIVSISPECFVCQMEVGGEGNPSFMFSKNGENFSFLCEIDKSMCHYFHFLAKTAEKVHKNRG